jgi:hypothetical protein
VAFVLGRVDARTLARGHPALADDSAHAGVAGRHAVERHGARAIAGSAMRNIALEIDAVATAASTRARAVHQALAVGAYLACFARLATRAAMIGARSEPDTAAVAGSIPIRAGHATRAFRASG